MTVDRGGLRYTIEVVDEFTGPIEDFRAQLRDLRRQTRTAQSQLRSTRRAQRRENLRAQRADDAALGISSERTGVTRQQRQDALRFNREILRIERQITAERRRRGREAQRTTARERRRLQGLQAADDRRAASRRRLVDLAERQADLERRAGFAAESREERRQRTLRDGIRRRRRSRQRLLRLAERQAEVERRAGFAAQAREERRQRTLRDGIRRRRRARQRLVNQRERDERRLQRQEEAAQRRRLRNERRIARERERARQQGIVATTGRGLRRGLIGAAASARRLFTILVALAAIRIGAEIIAGAARAFVEFNAQLEQANLGVASLFTAVGQVTDATGNAAEGAQALALAQGEARRQTALLRRDALQTAATFEELLETFQTAIGPGLTAGLNVDEIRRFSVRISQAATAIGLPQNQLAEEIRSLLQGTISARTTRIATALGITNEDIRRAREAGTLVEFLNQRFAAFDAAGREAQNTFAALSTNAIDAVRQILGFAGAETFEVLKTQLRDIFDALTDIDPITGELVPDPDVLDTAKILFDGLTGAIQDFRAEVSGISRQDVRATFAAIATFLRFGATAAGALTRSVASLGEALIDVLTIITTVGNAVNEALTVRVDSPLGAGQAGGLPQPIRNLISGLDTVRTFLQSTASASDEASAALGDVGSAAAVTANSTKSQADEAIASLEKLTQASRAASSVGVGGGRGAGAAARRTQQIARTAEEAINRILERRQVLRQQIEGLGNRDLRRQVVLSRLSAGDQVRVRGLVEGRQQILDISRSIAEAERQIAENQAARQNALRRGDLVQAQLIEQNIQGFQNQLQALQAQRSSIQQTNNAILSQAESRAGVTASLNEQLQIIAAISAGQRELNQLATDEDRIRRAQLVALNQANAQASQAALARAQSQQVALRDSREAVRIQQQAAQAQIRLSNLSERGQAEALQRLRQRTAIQQRALVLDQRRQALLQNIGQIEQEAQAILQNREGFSDEQIRAAQTSLDLANERRAAAEGLTSANDEVTQALQRQAGLENALLRQQQNRAEQQRLQSQLTGGRSTGGPSNVGRAAEQIFGTQQQQFEQAGQALGASIGGIISEAIAIEGQERGEVLNSYESLFGAIGGIASRVLRNVFSTRGIFKILGSVFAPIGIIGGAAGFARGGRIPGGKRFAASPGHFSRAQGLAEGGRPAGLPASDTVPIWATPGEFMQPVSAVRRYGEGVMEAIRQGSVDPFALRALAGARRTSVARPRMPAFQTGGEVSSNVQSVPASGGGVGAAVIVSSEDQLSNLLAGSGEAFLRYAQNNREDFRTALGL